MEPQDPGSATPLAERIGQLAVWHLVVGQRRCLVRIIGVEDSLGYYRVQFITPLSQDWSPRYFGVEWSCRSSSLQALAPFTILLEV